MARKLASGEELQMGQHLVSADGRFLFVLQEDRNLVHYGYSATGRKSLWSSGTAGWGSNAVVRMDPHGQMHLIIDGVVQRQYPYGLPDVPNTRLIAQDDGNVVIYRQDGIAIWSTGTWYAEDHMWVVPNALNIEISGGRLSPQQDKIVNNNGTTPIGVSDGVNRMVVQPHGTLTISSEEDSVDTFARIYQYNSSTGDVRDSPPGPNPSSDAERTYGPSQDVINVGWNGGDEGFLLA